MTCTGIAMLIQSFSGGVLNSGHHRRSMPNHTVSRESEGWERNSMEKNEWGIELCVSASHDDDDFDATAIGRGIVHENL